MGWPGFRFCAQMAKRVWEFHFGGDHSKPNCHESGQTAEIRFCRISIWGKDKASFAACWVAEGCDCRLETLLNSYHFLWQRDLCERIKIQVSKWHDKIFEKTIDGVQSKCINEAAEERTESRLSEVETMNKSNKEKHRDYMRLSSEQNHQSYNIPA